MSFLNIQTKILLFILHLIYYYLFFYLTLFSFISSLLCPHWSMYLSTGGCYNEVVVAIFRTGDGAKGKKNLYLLTL